MSKGCQASCRVDLGERLISGGATGLSHLPTLVALKLILGFKWSQGRGTRLYLKWMGKSGSFELEIRPLGTCSSYKLRPATSCGETGTPRDPFAKEVGESDLVRVEEGKTGL